jgi:hypothetical protein
MDIITVEKPKVIPPHSYKISKEEEEILQRRIARADELGIKLFILDESDESDELQKMEDFIVDNYIDLDMDVPDDIKKKYLELKKGQFSISRDVPNEETKKAIEDTEKKPD